MNSRPRLVVCTIALIIAAIAAAVPSSASASSYPNDPYFAREWHLRRIGAPDAWKTTKGKGVTIAVVDTGVYRNHPDLALNIAPQTLNAEDNSTNEIDGCTHNPGEPIRFCHGTFVAGVAAAVGNNRIGVIGVAPEAKIMAVQASTPGQTGIDSTAASTGIQWAADHGANIINLSLGSLITTLDPAILYATAKGALVVVAAGNDSLPLCESPGFDPAVICVGASDQLDGIASFSNYGLRIDVVAPGTGIWSTCAIPGGRFYSYCAADGTSAAAPIVSGIAALLMSMGANNLVAATIIRGTAKQLGEPPVYNPTYGFGRVDASAAVNLCKMICRSMPTG